ncbi:DUF3095 domain-containing protein [Paramagnetospirillum magneticum]|uniref:Adenylate cyclase n=1 Tax=Paramagnetospirillum magneticum (strain ATCC 700264 / AMB-1) TaxID=342108 RepID=Q2W7Y9_PARM1|nr:DUF3095 domain-containing protein [Paramagnetospirillum magneticum]BAE50036.1 hypothetical protein amb1232 [Paramagnetospirillum magneticum AMB-1]
MFDRLKSMTRVVNVFEDEYYRPAPPDWLAVATDVQGSTVAVEAGKQKTVNFVGASAIAALRNLCAPMDLPFQFGGDGAMALVPPQFAERARVELARARGFARREFGISLRVGAVPVATVTEAGGTILVGRYEPSPGNPFGMFSGGGMGLLEEAVKERGHPDLARLSRIPEELDDGEFPDLTGLSCRWEPLGTQRGAVIALLVVGDRDHCRLYRDLCRLSDSEAEGLKIASRENLKPGWPGESTMIEARLGRGRGGVWRRWLDVAAQTILVKLLCTLGLSLGGFDPRRYPEEVITNTAFVKHDDTLAVVFDCPSDRVDGLRAYLDEREARGELRYGLQISDVALMVCLVGNLSEGRHVHFMDGGDGGYTMAAKRLKAAAGAR